LSSDEEHPAALARGMYLGHPSATKEDAVQSTSFDVVVVGTGAAGQTVAATCVQGGKTVAVIDRLEFGGTCSLRG
jgi:glycerol-3-phosphate dehydrogenase